MKQVLSSFLVIASVLFLWGCPSDNSSSTVVPPIVTKSSAKDITKFTFAALSPSLDATIDATSKNITATMPTGTDITKLIPTITASDKATVSPATGSAQDFTNPVTYTVTAEDASTQQYKVTVTVAKPPYSWVKFPKGQLVQISVGKDGLVWGVNAAGAIYYLNSAGNDWVNVPGALKNVSVAADGTVWGVNNANMIYKWNGSNWGNPIPGALKQISVGNSGLIWGVNSGDIIYKWNGTDWGNPIQGALKWVSVASDGTTWGVNSADQIFKYSGNGWGNPLAGNLSQISVGKDGLVWGVNSANHVYKLNATGTNWDEPNPDARLANISVASDGTVWGTNYAGDIFHLIKN